MATEKGRFILNSRWKINNKAVSVEFQIETS